MDLGPAPVRIDPDGRAEVVWGQRLDPAQHGDPAAVG
jgi:hypothetical protein